MLRIITFGVFPRTHALRGVILYANVLHYLNFKSSSIWRHESRKTPTSPLWFKSHRLPPPIRNELIS